MTVFVRRGIALLKRPHQGNPNRNTVEVGKEVSLRPIERRGVLRVHSDPMVSVSLKVGEGAEQVKVKTTATLVETRTDGVPTVWRRSGSFRFGLRFL